MPGPDVVAVFGMLPEMCVHVTVGSGTPIAVHVMLSDVLNSLSFISSILGATADTKFKVLV